MIVDGLGLLFRRSVVCLGRRRLLDAQRMAHRRRLGVTAAVHQLCRGPTLPGNAAAHHPFAGHVLAVLAITAGRPVRAVRDVHLHHGQVPVVLAVIAPARLVRHQHFGALVRRRGGLVAAELARRLQADVLGDVPAPVGPVRAARTLERLAVQVADDVHVETRRGRRPERAMWALEHLRHNTKKPSNANRSVVRVYFQGKGGGGVEVNIADFRRFYFFAY